MTAMSLNTDENRCDASAGAAEGCDLLILIFSRSKDRSLRQLLQ
jgi:hypothetical protein